MTIIKMLLIIVWQMLTASDITGTDLEEQQGKYVICT